MAASIASPFWDYYICDYSLFDMFLKMNHSPAAMNMEIFLSGIVYIRNGALIRIPKVQNRFFLSKIILELKVPF